MSYEIVDKDGKRIPLPGPRRPRCMKDFCDSCGDCLVCHEEYECPNSEDGEHLWILDDETELK